MQQRWRYLPVLTVIGEHTGGLLVQPHDHAVLDGSIVGGELHTVALGKLGQLHRASGLGQKVQSFHHHAIEKQQVLLAHVARGLYEHLAVYNGLPRSHARQFMLVATQPIPRHSRWVGRTHTMQLHHLPLKRARHHPLAQAFEAVHLGLHQTSAVIAAPLFPDAAPQSVTGSQRFVARMRSHQGRLPRLGVLARGDHRLRISLGNRRMARLGVVGTVPTDAGNRLIGWYLLQQLEQHGRIAHAVVGHLDGPDLQRVGINTQVHLAPLAPVLGTVLLAFPFAFAKELNAGAVHQQFQCGGTGSVGQLYLQSLLASAHGAVVGHPPVQACQTQQAFNHAQALTQGQTEQALDAQTELDGCVGEDVLAPAFAAGWGVPLHAFVQPDCQRPSGFERGVVLCPVGGLVAGLGPLRFTHVSRLPAQRTGFVQQSL